MQTPEHSGPEKGKNTRKYVLLFLKVLISLSLVFYLLYVQIDNVNDIWNAIFAADPILLFVAFMLNTIGYLICSWRWQILLKAQGFFVPLIELIRAYTIGIFFNALLPGVMSGDFMRAHDISDRVPSYTRSFTTLFIERLTGMFGLLVLAVIALPLIGWQTIVETRIGWVLAFVGVGLFVLFSTFLSPKLQVFMSYLTSLKLLRVMRGPITKISETSKVFSDRKRPIYISALISIVFQANVVLHYYLIGLALGIDIPMYLYFAIIPVSLFIMIIPASINGIGIREQVFNFLFGYFGVAAHVSVSLAWIALGMVLVQAVVGGLIFTIRRKNVPLQA